MKTRGILSNLLSHILLLTHVYQRCDPCCYLGNQTGSVGGQSFQVLLLSSLCFPLVALQEQTQQQRCLITSWCQRLEWDCPPHQLIRMKFWESRRWWKNISHTFTSQLSGQWDLDICMMLMHSNHLLFRKSNSKQNEMSREIAHNNLKINVQVNKDWDPVCHFVYCFSVFSSIKAVAHLLIRADVPANHSDEKGKEIKAKKAISSLLNEPQMMRGDREFKLMSSHVTHRLDIATADFLMQQKQVAQSPPP